MKRLLSASLLLAAALAKREFDKRYATREEFDMLTLAVGKTIALTFEHDQELEAIGNELGQKQLMNYISNLSMN